MNRTLTAISSAACDYESPFALATLRPHTRTLTWAREPRVMVYTLSQVRGPTVGPQNTSMTHSAVVGWRKQAHRMWTVNPRSSLENPQPRFPAMCGTAPARGGGPGRPGWGPGRATVCVETRCGSQAGRRDVPSLKAHTAVEDWVTGEQATAGSQSTDPAWDEVGPQLPHMPHCAGCLRHTQADSNGHLAREEVRSPLQVRGLQLRGQVTRPRPRSGQTTEPGCELEF